MPMRTSAQGRPATWRDARAALSSFS